MESALIVGRAVSNVAMDHIVAHVILASSWMVEIAFPTAAQSAMALFYSIKLVKDALLGVLHAAITPTVLLASLTTLLLPITLADLIVHYLLIALAALFYPLRRYFVFSVQGNIQCC